MTTLHAKLLSKFDLKRKQLLAAVWASAIMGGPRSISVSSRPLKWKVVDDFNIPSFCHGYISLPNPISPSALFTESAPPLPQPPNHFINDLKIQTLLWECDGPIKVDTPFNINKFEALLCDYPNPTFIKSVITGLQDGFWHCNDRGWKMKVGEAIDNYPLSEEDMEAVHKHRDKEQWWRLEDGGGEVVDNYPLSKENMEAVHKHRHNFQGQVSAHTGRCSCCGCGMRFLVCLTTKNNCMEDNWRLLDFGWISKMVPSPLLHLWLTT